MLVSGLDPEPDSKGTKDGTSGNDDVNSPLKVVFSSEFVIQSIVNDDDIRHSSGVASHHLSLWGRLIGHSRSESLNTTLLFGGESEGI